jgi:hypothetical protein
MLAPDCSVTTGKVLKLSNPITISGPSQAVPTEQKRNKEIQSTSIVLDFQTASYIMLFGLKYFNHARQSGIT